MIKKSFKVVEIRESGVTITHYLRGTRRNIERAIDEFKNQAKKYEMFGKTGMMVWV